MSSEPASHPSTADWLALAACADAAATGRRASPRHLIGLTAFVAGVRGRRDIRSRAVRVAATRQAAGT